MIPIDALLRQLAEYLGAKLDLVAGVLLGLLGRFIYDRLSEPHLEILGYTGPWRLVGEIAPGILPDRWAQLGEGPIVVRAENFLAYRVRVRNRQKSLLNSAGENCVPWLIVEGAPEPYALSWIGAQKSVTINIGDEREFDLCAVHVRTGTLIAPTESQYFPSRRMIAQTVDVVRGLVRVTSANAKKAERRIEIRPAAEGLQLVLTEEDP